MSVFDEFCVQLVMVTCRRMAPKMHLVHIHVG